MPRTYVDNAMNRSLGRVGMSVGSMPVSRSGGSSMSSGGGGSGWGGGGYSSSYGSSYSAGPTASTPKTYVDNSANRSLGRVGMPVGSMPVSKSASGSRSTSHSYGADDSGYVHVGNNTPSRTHSSSSPKTYVDNAANRSLGRVGMPLGSMPVSKSSNGSRSTSHSYGADDSGYVGNYSPSRTHSASTPKTYVDNAANRSLGRVGMPLGSMPVSKSSRGDQSTSSSRRSVDSSSDTYVDNYHNRKLGRVGLPKGSMPETSVSSRHSNDDTISPLGIRVYKDNPLNRQLGRVGKPLGSCVYNKATQQKTVQFYADTKMNRELGRVGLPRGSVPCKKSVTTKKVKDVIQKLKDGDDIGDIDMTCDSRFNDEGIQVDDLILQAFEKLNRQLEEREWMERNHSGNAPRTSQTMLRNFKGTIIPYEELEFRRKIGHGGFGDVFFAEWQGAPVAVKKLIKGRISGRRLREFEEEVLKFCDLEHENIVNFIGACIERPNLCIVMEYMEMSLFEAIHIRDDEVEFTESELLDIICQTCNGVQYLHSEKIAHCDLKSENVLLNISEGLAAKITDFGLSMMKSDTVTSSSAANQMVKNIGTPRYSAPEVLRGEELSASGMMRADIYSLALVIYEVLFQEEPFYNFTYPRLQKEVGQRGTKPNMPLQHAVRGQVVEKMMKGLDFESSRRPKATDMYDFFSAQDSLYSQ